MCALGGAWLYGFLRFALLARSWFYEVVALFALSGAGKCCEHEKRVAFFSLRAAVEFSGGNFLHSFFFFLSWDPFFSFITPDFPVVLSFFLWCQARWS